MYREIILNEIEDWRGKLEKLALDIWNSPEAGLHEYRAQKWTADLLREAGFEVTLEYGGLETAIRASYGSGKPVYGLLGEYDALPDLSQQVCTFHNPVVPGGLGHGCGHNLLGTAHVGAAIAVKKLIETGKLNGTVVFLGCPAEEILVGKGIMAKNGAFDDLDFNVSFHPGTHNDVMLGNLTGVKSFKLHFRGRTAHAGASPWDGRSALDALELTHSGINYLREHVPDGVRMHYVITNGGFAPNIVPDRATGWYNVRAHKLNVLEDVYSRVIDIAKGAALMTGTDVEVEAISGCYPTLNNHVLAKAMHQIMLETPQEPWTQGELQFAAALNKNDSLKQHLHTGVTSLVVRNGYGSSDAGDVEHICPGIFFSTACYNIAAGGHTWQNTACTGTSIGLKGMIYAAKVMALWGAKVMSDPQLLSAAKSEFEEKTQGISYVCPVPANTSLLSKN